MVGSGRQVWRGIDEGAVEIEDDGGVSEIKGHRRCSVAARQTIRLYRSWKGERWRLGCRHCLSQRMLRADRHEGQPKSEAEPGSLEPRGACSCRCDLLAA